MGRVTRFIDALSGALGRAVFWGLFAMVLLGAFNALVRYLGKGLGASLSSNTWIELQWYLFSVVFLLGGAYTLRHDAHVRVDVFYDRFPTGVRRWINIVGHVLFLLPFCLLMVWVSWRPAVESVRTLEASPDPGGLPRYVIRLVVPLAFGLLFLQGISELIKQVRREAVSDEEAPPRGEDHL